MLGAWVAQKFKDSNYTPKPEDVDFVFPEGVNATWSRPIQFHRSVSFLEAHFERLKRRFTEALFNFTRMNKRRKAFSYFYNDDEEVLGYIKALKDSRLYPRDFKPFEIIDVISLISGDDDHDHDHDHDRDRHRDDDNDDDDADDDQDDEDEAPALKKRKRSKLQALHEAEVNASVNSSKAFVEFAKYSAQSDAQAVKFQEQFQDFLRSQAKFHENLLTLQRASAEREKVAAEASRLKAELQSAQLVQTYDKIVRDPLSSDAARTWAQQKLDALLQHDQ